jgi:hypothetical protein
VASKGIQEKLELQLSALEEEFRSLLIGALERCTDGGRGVFLSEIEASSRDLSRQLVWPEAKQLCQLEDRISEIRNRLAMPKYSLASRFREYCDMRGENLPGGNKLAARFLAEIGSGELD